MSHNKVLTLLSLSLALLVNSQNGWASNLPSSEAAEPPKPKPKPEPKSAPPEHHASATATHHAAHVEHRAAHHSSRPVEAPITTLPLPSVDPVAETPKEHPKSKNLIVNGSFEQSVDPGSGWQYYRAPSTAIYGWTVISGDIDLWGGVKTPFGKKTIDLDGQQAGAVVQGVPTEPGCTYRLKFWVGSYDTLSKNVYARVAGKKQIWPISVTGSTEHPCMRELTMDFKARDKVTSIEIGSATQGTQGPVLDNVSCEKIADAERPSAPSRVAAPPPIVEEAPPSAAAANPPADAESSKGLEEIQPPPATYVPGSTTP